MSEFVNEGGDLSDADFNELLAGLVGKDLTDDQRETLAGSDTSVARGLTEGESTPAVSAPAEQTVEAGAAPEVTTEQDDPLAALIAQHGGDVNAALAAVVSERDNAQSLIGRQGSELGELRKLIEDRLPAQEEEEQAWEMPAQVPFVDEQTAQGLDQMYSENGGPNTMEWIATYRPDLFDAALKTWGSYEPFEAARFATRYEANLAEYERSQQAPPAVDSRMEEFLAERSLQTAIAAARETVDDATWGAIAPTLPDVLGTLPKEVQGMVVSPDGETQKAGVQLAVEIAKGRLIASATKEAQAAADQQVTATKQATMVATGSLRPVAKGQAGGSGEMTSEQRQAAFKEALLATETTSVADGLVESR